MHKLVQIADGRIDSDSPVFVIYDGRLYRTVNHPLGWAEKPDYEIRDDGRIYRTGHHRLGAGKTPDYEFHEDGCLYRSAHHPDGTSPQPTYALV
jgi:hypothetical protein